MACCGKSRQLSELQRKRRIAAKKMKRLRKLKMIKLKKQKEQEENDTTEYEDNRG